MICNKCEIEKLEEFYKNDKTCKECRKEMVRSNREKNCEYYREYDKKRFQNDPRVKERHLRYVKTEAGKLAVKKSGENWRLNNLVKRAANVIIGNYVRDGKIIKPALCSECGKGGRIHGHHDDYAFPLVVRWLCPSCHSKWHKENGEGLNAR